MNTSVKLCGRCGVALSPRGGVAPKFCPRCGLSVTASLPRASAAMPGTKDIPASALAALAAGLVGLFPGCVPAGFLAVILGIYARIRISGADGRLGGGGIATAGIILGLIASGIWTIVCATATL